MTHDEYLKAVRNTLAAQAQQSSTTAYEQLKRMNNLKTLTPVSSKNRPSVDGVKVKVYTLETLISLGYELDKSTT